MGRILGVQDEGLFESVFVQMRGGIEELVLFTEVVLF